MFFYPLLPIHKVLGVAAPMMDYKVLPADGEGILDSL